MSVLPDVPQKNLVEVLAQRQGLLLGLLSILVAIAFGLSLMLGPEGFGLPGGPGMAQLVLLEIRLPRAILGLLVGGALVEVSHIDSFWATGTQFI